MPERTELCQDPVGEESCRRSARLGHSWYIVLVHGLPQVHHWADRTYFPAEQPPCCLHHKSSEIAIPILHPIIFVHSLIKRLDPKRRYVSRSTLAPVPYVEQPRTRLCISSFRSRSIPAVFSYRGLKKGLWLPSQLFEKWNSPRTKIEPVGNWG